MTDYPKGSETVASAIVDLKKGLLTGSKSLEASGLRNLYEAGAEAAGPLLLELKRINLEQFVHPESTTLLAGLAAILHDISEEDSREFIEDALSRQCHPVNRSVLQAVERFSRSHFRLSSFDGIEVLEANSIEERHNATSHILHWLSQVPKADLSGISKIYIIDESSGQDYLGHHLWITAVITIVWPRDLHPFLSLQWLTRFRAENTVYHEIGHHRHGHKEGGQVPEQEAEANDYARKMMRQSHPRLRKIATILKRLFRIKRPNPALPPDDL